MPKLIILDHPYINVYNEREILINLAYGSEDHPKDHLGRPLTAHHASLSQHLIHHLLPKLAQHIERAKSPYEVSQQIEFPNNSSMPAIVITRSDNDKMKEDDLEKIHALFTEELLPKMNRASLSTLFPPSEKAAEEDRHYQTRRPS